MKYEIMFIVRPDLDEKGISAVAKQFEKVLTDNGAKILSSKELGQRELAYEMNKQKSGYYFLINAELTHEAINEFNRLANINESILRHMIMKLDK